MKTLAVCGSAIAAMNPNNTSISTVQLAGQEVVAGVMSISEPEFDGADQHRNAALIEVTAFSCNYRDKALILRAATQLPEDRFYSIGSEFVGVVLAVGDDVESLRVGQRVIPDGFYPKTASAVGGLPTNHGSRQVQIHDVAKLMPIPDSIDDATAASLTIGAQTSYGMVRRLDLTPSSNVLVTAARSNTSLFAIQALRQVGCTVAVTTTSPHDHELLASLGADEVFQVDRDVATFADDSALRAFTVSIGGFDAVVDPFFDIHLHKVVPLMAFNARYITCGLADQYSDYVDQRETTDTQSITAAMLPAMMYNLELLGNCLGTTDDLRRGVDDCAQGALSVPIDSVHDGDSVAEFLERTYIADDRTGKVVYHYPAV